MVAVITPVVLPFRMFASATLIVPLTVTAAVLRSLIPEESRIATISE